MQEYEVKRGMTKDLPDRIAAGFSDIFEVKPTEKDGHYMVSYGSMSRLEVWAGEKNKTVIVDTETNKEVLAMPDAEADKIILDTNKRFRQYLDLITGFTTKERVKRAKKAADAED
ncbi:hypothetical protein McpSp1_10360 [Methanocorpusculaceae archaeon Sp1]|uniref:DUF5611 domain-containing protein n=1 Tax=Methanorbis furvi TaxID=3028299 RepID=A0AAE4ME12_9EURY|nr:hypothetical protein [Methanocorpusculaceae archaeon Sp1]MDV0442411.1 hypothetical protein [Methanocorpusculaceae archaeon Ag1]